MTHELLNYVEQTLITKLDNDEYLTLCNMIKTIHDQEKSPPLFEDLIVELNEYGPDQITESIESDLSYVAPEKLPLEMLRAINELCEKNTKLDTVILNMAKLHSDLLNRYESLSQIYSRRLRSTLR